jgi:hypothetical protein
MVSSARCLAPVLSLIALSASCLAATCSAEPLDRDTILRRCADGEDRFWRNIAEKEPYESLGCRKVFASAMAICEARRHGERLSRLYELAARFQDRNPESSGYGNLRWYWRDARVTDRNAVEFCMQDALLTWSHHREWISEPAREQLRELMALGIEGCMRHRVRTSYTNIALLNAANLIGLGEAFHRPEVAEEGYRRLDLICLWTWRFGTHEYCSPTYYGVDLQGVDFIQHHAQREQGRQQARALAELLWKDIALNWLAPAGRLAGSQSRSYDYLRGLGSLDRYLQVQGWIDAPIVPGPAMVHPLRFSGATRGELLHQAESVLPRLVRQSWGPESVQSRTHMLYEDVTLSTSGANYGAQDMPMTVDLPGDRQAVRCYFIPDGREDPYGKVKYETGSARHQKALHLKPFWTAAQRTGDAVGLVVYRDTDLQQDVVTNLQSHFVLRRENDGIWIGGAPVALTGATKQGPAVAALAVGQPLVLRYGSAAVGIRVLWAHAQDLTPPAIALVDDGNPFGAIRLTVDHHREKVTAWGGAAFWVRVGSSLATADQFSEWRTAFERLSSKASPLTVGTVENEMVVEATKQGLRFEVPGVDGPVALSAAAPFDGRAKVELTPEPTSFPLELNGKDVARPLFDELEPIRSYREQLARVRPIRIPAAGNVEWEAEAGLVFPGMTDGEDARASGGRFVWHPKGEPIGSRTGSLTFQLDVAKAGTYFLWGRVLAPDPQTDSFYVVLEDTPALPPSSASWHTQNGPRWQWRPVALDRAKEPARFNLPAGRTTLQFRARESGTKLERLFLTREVDSVPQDH